MRNAQPPNLLFIFTDEQRRDTLACYGNRYLQMPHLNRFAESACIFDDAHCTNPVCTPSRGSLMTGLYPHAHGATYNNIPIHPQTRCLPELLSPETRSAYHVEYHGKWHLGDEIYAQHGHERFVSIEDQYRAHFTPHRNRNDRSDYHHFLISQGFTLGTSDVFPRSFASQLPEQFGKPKFLADRACEFLIRNRHRPWLLTVNFLEPHMPFHGPRDAQYPPSEIPLFPNFDHIPDAPGQPPVPRFIHGKLEMIRSREYEGFQLLTEDGWRGLTARYLGLCSLVDTHIGRILHTLEQQGLADSTIVVFTADHGDMMGSHRLIAKELIYRDSVRIPLLVRLPGQRRSARMTGPVSQIDLVPTLIDLLGENVPSHLHGRSLAPALRAQQDHRFTDDASPCIIVQDNPDVQTRSIVSRDGWRYTRYVTTDEHELYDLNHDPGERHNLAGDAQHKGWIRRMCTEISNWGQRVDDPTAIGLRMESCP